MSLHEPTHGRRHGGSGDDDLDVPNGTDPNGPWIHRQMDGQNQRTERPDDRPEQALSDVGIDGGTDDEQSDSDLEQLSAEAYRSGAADDDTDEEETGPVASASGTQVFVRDTTGERTVESTERFDGMQSHLGRRPKSISRVKGCAISDIVAFRAQTETSDDEPDPTVAQASGYLARD